MRVQVGRSADSRGTAGGWWGRGVTACGPSTLSYPRCGARLGNSWSTIPWAGARARGAGLSDADASRNRRVAIAVALAKSLG